MLQPNCRLCGSPSAERFTARVLAKYDVHYFECQGCGSLQTEPPSWLSEAYSHHLSALDTGAAQRNLSNAAATLAAARVLGATDVLDLGGGDGLLCRLLRDYGLNAFVQDKFATATYSQGYTEPDFARPALVTAFEVFEHFAEPQQELAAIFALGADSILASTEIYTGQDAQWWYLTPESGQHIFFYTRRALAAIAATHGYRTRFPGRYIFFSRSDRRPAAGERWLTPLLSGKSVRLLRAILQLRPAPGVDRDFLAQRRRQH